MKWPLVIPFLATLMTNTFAASPKIQEGHFVFNPDKNLLKIFKSHKDLVIDHVSEDGFEVYGPKGLETYLSNLRVDHIKLDAMDKNLKSMPFSSYPTPEQISVKIKEIAAAHPSILKVFSIGQSHEGRELLMVKISDNVEQDEVEPEFKYIANMHGNEIVGRELMVKLIEDLATGYANNDPEIVRIINSTETYIMPTMNPDGSSKKRRGNAQWADLNRDFPDFTTGDNSNTFEGRQPETQAIMKFQRERNFAFSANFHGGSVVVNYPWDTSEEKFPLEKLIVDLSKEYASTVPGMGDSRRFKDGVVNGYRWYEVDGGMQDWSYNWHNDLQVTIELSDNKWPNYSEMEGFYNDNRSSLIRYIKRIHQGAGVKIQNAETGAIHITYHRNDDLKIDQELGTFGFKNGEFYKVLGPGQYTFDIKSTDGKQKVIKVNVNEDLVLENGNYKNIIL